MQHAFQRRPSGDCWNDVINKAKYDIVRKMQKMLKDFFCSDSENIRNTDEYICDVIDHISKMLLEEDKRK
jgi:hypothetical protein